MFFLLQKMLELSMRMGKCRCRFLRLAGRILGLFPVWYSCRMEKRLMDGIWDPSFKWKRVQRKRQERIQRKKWRKRRRG